MENCRTPPALKWLIDKRARLSGELIKLREQNPFTLKDLDKEVERARFAYEAALAARAAGERNIALEKEKIEANIRAVDATMALHDVKIDPNIVPPIRSQDHRLFRNHGEITRSIYATLRKAQGIPLSALDIAIYMQKSLGLDLTEEELKQLRKKIRMMMKSLCWQGKLVRIHQAKTRQEGRWILAGELNHHVNQG